MELKAGARLASAVCATEVVVVAAPTAAVTVECGGAPMVEPDADRPMGGPSPERAEGSLIGKRYTDSTDLGLELLCSKAGDGSLSVDGEPLILKDAKPLPSSD